MLRKNDAICYIECCLLSSIRDGYAIIPTKILNKDYNPIQDILY